MTGARSPLFLSMLMAFGGFSLWTWGDAMTHALQAYPVMLVIFVADAFSVLFLCLLAQQLGGFRETFARPRLKLRIFRGVLLTASNFLSFYAFMHLELTKAYAIIFLIPLMAKVLSVLIMKEKIRAWSWIISAAGFAGVLIVLRPGWVPVDSASLAALGVTFVFALGYVLSRYIGEENQTPLSMAIFQYSFATLGAAYPGLQALQNVLPTPFAFLLMGGIGLVGAVGSVLVARGFASAPSANIAPIHYTQILWGALLGAVFFGEYPDFWTVLGGAVIVGAGLLLIRSSRDPVAIPTEPV